jgi:hypothetical protein
MIGTLLFPFPNGQVQCTSFFSPINYVIYAKVAEMYIIANNNDNEDIFY